MNQNSSIRQAINNTIETKRKILENPEILAEIEKVSEEIVRAFQNHKKVLLCGNGGSAADAQHLAAEFSGKFYLDRAPLSAEALHVNSSYMTAVANDFGYDEVFARLVQGTGKEGDVLIGLSTSGNSGNIVKAIEIANIKNMITVGFTGEGGGKMAEICRHTIKVPSTDTPRIQESHILIGHIICEIVEKQLFS